jgi:hypothetical protein
MDILPSHNNPLEYPMPPYARGNPAHWWKTRSCGKGSRAPSAMFVSPLRRTLSASALLTLSVTLAAGWYITRPARISRLAETLLSTLLGGNVTVRSGHLSLSGTLLLSGVQVTTQPEPGQLPLPLFSADQIEARFDWLSLLVGELRSTQLTALRPTLYLIEDHDLGKWNYELLRKKPPESQPAKPGRPVTSLPVLALREARVQWGEVAKGHLAETAAAIIDGQFTPSTTLPIQYHFSLAQRTETSTPLSPNLTAPQPIVVTGAWDINDNRLSATTDEIRLTDAVKSALPASVRTWWTDNDLTGSFSHLWVTLDKDNGMQVGAVADHLGMTLKATPSPDGALYRVKLADVHGKFTVGVTKPGVRIEDLEGRVLGFRFKADGDVGGADPNALALNIEFPGAVLGDEYPPIFMAFPPSQDLIQRLAPHGKFDISLELRRGDMGGTGGPNGDKVLVNGTVLCHDARMRFGPLPYPLTHMNGAVDFTQDSVTFRNVTCAAGETLVHIDGVTGTNPTFPKIDFKVWSDNAVFDDRLAACLPEKFEQVWNQFVLNATGAFVCTVKRDTDFRAAPKVRVDVTIADGTGYAKALPYRFYNAHGKLSLSDDQTDVHDFTINCGADRSGKIQLNGVIHHPGGDVANLLPVLTVKADIPLDSRLIKALPPEASALFKGITIAGRLAFDGTVERKSAQPGDPLAGVHLAGAVGMREGTVRSTDGAWALSQIAVQAALHDGQLQLDSASADILNGIHLSAAGEIDLLHRTGTLQLAADSQQFPLPPDAPSFVPPAAKDLWKSYQPAGPIDLHAQATLTLGALNAGATTQPAVPNILPNVQLDTYACTVTAQGVTLSNLAWPAPLTNIHGTVHALPGQLHLHNLTAAIGPATLSGDADYATTTGACTLTASLNSPGLPPEWTHKLPAALRTFFDTHQATGNLTLTLNPVTRAHTDAPWNFNATLAATHFALTTRAPTPATQSTPVPTTALAASRPAPPVAPDPFALTADQLTLAGAGTLANATLGFIGKLNGTTLGLAGESLDSLAAEVTLSSTDHTIRLTNIDGSVAGGSLQGTLRIEPENDGRYEADLSLKDAALAGLILPRNASADDRRKVGEGRVSATLAVQQTFGPHGDRTGRGELIVQDGKIYNVPLAMGLMQVATLRLPVARAFDRAEMSYFLRDNKVTFEKILLQSPSINLAGTGTLSLKDKALDLNFVTESPNEVKLPIISPIINTIRSELLQLAVTGTIDNPKVTPVPLSALSAPLRALLPHRQQASEK